MQFKTLSVLAVGATLAAATATPQRRNGIPVDQCNTSDIQCCTFSVAGTETLIIC